MRKVNKSGLTPKKLAYISESVEQSIGRSIRQHRADQKITIEQLSSRVGLTKGQISKIENGLVSSPVSTLTRIAQALGTEPGSFFKVACDRLAVQLVRGHQRKIVVGRASKLGHTYHSLAFDLPFEKKFEPYLMIISEKKIDPKKNTFQHQGQEMLFVLKGKMDYRHDGKIYSLEPGDTLYFDASLEHGPEKIVLAPVEFLCVISNK